MKQVLQSARSGKLAVKDVPAPKAGAGEILVRTRTSLISAGTERMVVEFAKKSLAGKARARPDLVNKVLAKARTDGIKATFAAVMARLDEPLPLGYSAAGTVIDVGPGLEGRYRVGDRVAVAGAGIANHAEINAVPENLAAIIPPGVGDEEACFGTIGAISLHAVRNLDAKLGECVAVIGVGLVGQLAAQLLSLAGIRVFVLDYDRERLDLAGRLGAELTIDLSESGVVERIMGATKGLGCDAILIAAATATNEPFEMAAAIARDRARVCLVGLSGTQFPYADFMKKELTVVVSRSYGPGRYDQDFEGRGYKYPPGFVRWTETENLSECLRLMAQDRDRKLDVAPLISHRFDIEMAEDAYALVVGRSAPHLGVVLAYPESEEITPKPVYATSSSSAKCVIGVIGAGNFAGAVILPELKKLSDVDLHTIVTRRGASAADRMEKFGFAMAATDVNEVFDNPEINAVLIATRHDSHSDLVRRALEAGKSVLVEKPLGLSRAEIDAVATARETADGFFQIGFNRRFAPMAQRTREILATTEGRKFMVLRINAGPIPADHWTQNPDEGGGRILGEVCHFVDLARYFAATPIESVQADAVNPDDVTATLRFSDGSLATIAYTSLGDPAYPKERFEIYAGGKVIGLDNFRRLTIAADGASKTQSGNQDKGFSGSLKAFVAAVRSGGSAPIDEAELIETSLATIAILESLQSGERIFLDRAVS